MQISLLKTTVFTVLLAGAATSVAASPNHRNLQSRQATIAECQVITNAPVSTNLDPQGWDYTETRVNGHVNYVSKGLYLFTDGSTDTVAGINTDKAAGYKQVNIRLAGEFSHGLIAETKDVISMS
jgi:hypothetical protein